MLLWREFASRHATASFAPTANCMSSNSYAIACASSDCNSNSVLFCPGEGRQLQLLLCTQVQASPDYNCMSSKRVQLFIVLWGMREDSNPYFKYLLANLIVLFFKYLPSGGTHVGHMSCLSGYPVAHMSAACNCMSSIEHNYMSHTITCYSHANYFFPFQSNIDTHLHTSRPHIVIRWSQTIKLSSSLYLFIFIVFFIALNITLSFKNTKYFFKKD